MAAKNAKSGRNAPARSGSNENRSAPPHLDVEALTKQIQQLTTSSPILSAFLETLLVSLNQICSLEAALDDSVRLSIQETQTANGKVLRALEAINGQRAILDSKQEIIQSVIKIILEAKNSRFEFATSQTLAQRKEALVKEWMAKFARMAYERSVAYEQPLPGFEGLDGALNKLKDEEQKSASKSTSKRCSV